MPSLIPLKKKRRRQRERERVRESAREREKQRKTQRERGAEGREMQMDSRTEIDFFDDQLVCELLAALVRLVPGIQSGGALCSRSQGCIIGHVKRGIDSALT